MANEASITVQLNYNKNNALVSCPAANFRVNVAGNNAIKNVVLVGLTDTTLALGGISTIGLLWMHNLANVVVPPPPILSAITQFGTGGAATWSYVVVGVYADGSLSPSVTTTTTTGNATLTGSNYNILTWAATEATSYNVYRTVSGGTPSTLGKIATGATSPYHDTGGAGDGATTPTGTTTNSPIQWGHTSGTYPNQAYAGEIGLVRWNSAAIHLKATVISTLLEYAIIEN